MYTEDDLLPLSGLQHLRFCERQWGLIHLEGQWAENRLTAEGRVLHERAHEGSTDSRPGLLIARGLVIRSLRHGITGQTDVVEFRCVGKADRLGVEIAGRKGLWQIFPVEYKRGKPKSLSCDEIQLCAQALCLEEMFNCTIAAGALFYGEPRRRTEVAFERSLRAETESLCQRMHELFVAGKTPSGRVGKHCRRCSLETICMPSAGHVARYLSEQIQGSFEEL